MQHGFLADLQAKQLVNNQGQTNSLIPSGELTFCHGKSPFLIGKFTISMAIFHCYVTVHQRVSCEKHGTLQPRYAWFTSQLYLPFEKPPEVGITQDLTSKNADFLGDTGKSKQEW